MDIKTEEIKNIDNLFEVHKYFMEDKETWIFRGQDDSEWQLATRLEREINRFGQNMKDTPEIERGLLRRFKRECQNYLTRTPAPGNYMEWFALMQHYGAPTRLLDWTYSFFVATHFAVEKTKHKRVNEEKGQKPAIWAFKANCIDSKMKQMFPEIFCDDKDKDPNLQLYKDFENVFMQRHPQRFVVPMNPFEFNKRLVLQQGVFLCSGDVSVSFMENLSNTPDPENNIRKYEIPDNLNLRKEILYNLHRMNINKATLFPDLQGFAESLSTLLAFPDVVNVLPADSEYVKEKLWT